MKFIENLLRRPLVVFAISQIIGILVANKSNSFFFVCAFLLFLSVCIYALYNKIKGRMILLIGILAFYSIGAFQFLLLEHNNSERFSEYGMEYVTIKGFIASEVDIKESKVSYVIDVTEIGYNGVLKKAKGKILLSTVLNEKTIALEYGREVKFLGQLSLPNGVRNPGGFDYRRYLAQKGVSAMVFAMSGDISREKGRKSSALTDFGHLIRKRIVYVVENSLPRQQAGLLNGILIGYREGLTDEVQNAFSDSGLTHVMAVSGANVAFLVFPLIFIFKKLHVRHNIAYALIIAFLILFVYITGFEPSVLRAVIMGIVILLGRILMRDPDIFTSIAFSAILLLVSSPYMLFNIGFQLSYAATLSLVLFSKNIKQFISFRFIHPKVSDVLAVTLSAQLGVMPITLFYFNKLSIISVLSNLLVVPLIELITVLGMLMAILGQFCLLFSQVLGYVNCLLLSCVLYVVKISAGLPFSVIRTVTPSVIAVVAYYCTTVFFLLFVPQRKTSIRLKYVAAIIAFFTISTVAFSMLPGKLEVDFLDVGEGDSAFIRTYSGKVVLIDGGGSTNPTLKAKVGESVLLPFLLDKGITSIDAVIATHGHTDHIQGLMPVLEEFKVRNLIIPSLQSEDEFKQLLGIAVSRDVRIGRCSKGDTIRIDKKTSFEVLHPPDNYIPDNSSLNNTSLVLKLLYKETEVLFTGDAEIAIEELLIKDKAFMEADVLKVAHHGSDTSTSQEFLECINPKAAIISVGKNNFGHPSDDVVKRLAGEGILIFRTDEAGAVVLKSDGIRISIEKTVLIGGKN